MGRYSLEGRGGRFLISDDSPETSGGHYDVYLRVEGYCLVSLRVSARDPIPAQGVEREWRRCAKYGSIWIFVYLFR